MLIPTTIVNAPNTTIAIGSIKVVATIAEDLGVASLNLQVLDAQGKTINLPRPLDGITSAEKTALFAYVPSALPMGQAIEMAALPYIIRVLGIVGATHA